MATLTSTYATKSATYFHAHRGEMLDFIPPDASNIIDFGCAAGVFASQIKARQTARVVGVELMAEPAEQARKKLDQVFQRDIEKGLNFLDGQLFDCAVFIDVLEHLVSPWDVLRELRNYLAPNGVVVASIPNVRYYEVLKMLLLRKRFRYENAGVMDRTHLRWFTRDDMVDLFEDASYSIDRIQAINGKFPWKFGLLNKLLLGALADTEHQQYAVVARSK